MQEKINVQNRVHNSLEIFMHDEFKKKPIFFVPQSECFSGKILYTEFELTQE